MIVFDITGYFETISSVSYACKLNPLTGFINMKLMEHVISVLISSKDHPIIVDSKQTSS